MSHFGAQYDDLITAIEANTTKTANAMSEVLAELADAKKNGDPLTDAQFDRLTAVRDHLAAIGTDLQAPVPSVPVAVTAPVVEVPVEHTAPESTPTL